jgi:hypothetical protein
MASIIRLFTIVLAVATGVVRSDAQLHHFSVEATGGGAIGGQAAGVEFFIQVVAQDSFNSTVPGFTGTVEISSDGNLLSGGGTTPPFTGGTLGPYPVSILNTGNFSLSVTRTGGVETGASNQFPVSPGPLDHFLVEDQAGGPVGTHTAYTPFFIQVVAQDTFNNVMDTFTGTVNITSNGPLLSGGGTSPGFSAGILPAHSVTFGSGGSFIITATNSVGPESGGSNSFLVNNPPPNVSTLSPPNRTAGDSGFTLTVIGSGFTPASSVLFSGTALPTSFVADTHLTAMVSPGDVDTAGTFEVTVSTPAPGGGVSDVAFLTVTDPVVSVKVFLEGPYSGGVMSTQLLADGVIPPVQPFSGPPWNYAGAESVATFPPAVVDWILVELREGTSGVTTVSKRAAFLRNDGVVIDTDGTLGVSMPGAVVRGYYIVVRQRNHIAVMSSTPRPMNAPIDSCDFSASPVPYFGGNAKSLGGAVFGMFSGDYSGDDFIDAADFAGPDNEIFQSGYRRSDLNLDGFIDASDFTFPDNNIFIGSDVPN